MLPLRPFQKEALDALFNSQRKENHVLCIAPTGSGKSLIYEKAASLVNQRTVLITPLIALARQQYEKLKSLQISATLGAGTRGSSTPPSKSGAWILSPEMLQTPSKQKVLSDWKPTLLVVDECHCLWEWGEGFRPSFNLVPQLLKQYSISTSLWLTATLPYEGRLQLRKSISSPLTELGAFSLPPRLHLFVRKTPWINRTETLIRWIQERSGFGIVFVNTRSSTERIARIISQMGKKVVFYHGGMSVEERKNIEKQVEQKIPDIIVCTSAFGMGMDYRHLSHVALWQAPTSLLSLVQIVGRVGRNLNQVGSALILWDDEDFQVLEWTIGQSEKRKQEIKNLYDFLSTRRCRLTLLKEHFDRIQTSDSCNQCDVCLQTE